MTLRTIAAAIVITTAGLVGVAMQPAAGQNAASTTTALRVLVSNGMKGSVEALQPQCEKAVGRPMAIQFSSTASLKKRIEAGETFDVTIITIEAIGDLTKQGLLIGDSRRDLGRSELGIGIRAGARKPDISTPEALRKTLREVPSITYPQDGASRGYLENMFERMGIAADVKPKIILAPGSGPATESVATGKATLVLTLFSEIVPVHGVDILGPLPGEYQSDIRFAAATSSKSTHADAAKALIAFLAGSQAAPVFKANGIEPR